MRVALAILCGLICFTGSVFALPPHPDLLEQVRMGEIARPVAFDATDLLAQSIPHVSYELDEEVNTIVLLVCFSDSVCSFNAQEFDTLFFSNDSGSVNHYFNDLTGGGLTFATSSLPSFLGWRGLPESKAWYMNDQQGLGEYPQNSQRLVMDAITQADPFVDFSVYDNDGDGEVEQVIIVHAGPSAQQTGQANDPWSFTGTTQLPVEVDDIVINNFILLPEYVLTHSGALPLTVGPPAMELAKSWLGMVDLTDPLNEQASIGQWSLMAYGCWNGPQEAGECPAWPDPYNRMLAGLTTPFALQRDSINALIPAASLNDMVFQLWREGEVGTEYFLLENRRQSGYNTYLPGAGLLLYHIDETVTTGNQYPWYPGGPDNGHFLVALEQADSHWDLETGTNFGDAGDPWPGSTNAQVFDQGSVPNSRSYSDAYSRVEIRNISTADSLMQAILRVGIAPAVEAPDNLAAAIDQTTGVVTLNWEFDIVAQTDELAYDNSQYTGFYYWNDGTMAVRFTPQSICQVLALKFFTRNVSTFEAQVFSFHGNQPDTTAQHATQATSEHYNWVTVDVENGGLYYNTSFVAGFHGMDEIASLGADASIETGRSWDYNGEEWSQWPEAYLVRAVVRYLATGETVILTPDGTLPAVQAADVKSPSLADFGAIQNTDELDEFLEFNVYRNFELIGTTTNILYSDTLDEFGMYRYYVTAQHDIGESSASNQQWVRYEDQSLEQCDKDLLPEKFSIASVYPNPFNNEATVTIHLPESGYMKLEVFNILGETAGILVSSPFAAGAWDFEINGASLSSGIYLLRATLTPPGSNTRTAFHKMVLLK